MGHIIVCSARSSQTSLCKTSLGSFNSRLSEARPTCLLRKQSAQTKKKLRGCSAQLLAIDLRTLIHFFTNHKCCLHQSAWLITICYQKVVSLLVCRLRKRLRMGWPSRHERREGSDGLVPKYHETTTANFVSKTLRESCSWQKCFANTDHSCPSDMANQHESSADHHTVKTERRQHSLN